MPMVQKIIEDKKTGEFYAVEYDSQYPLDYRIVGKRGTKEEAQKLLD